MSTISWSVSFLFISLFTSVPSSHLAAPLPSLKFFFKLFFKSLLQQESQTTSFKPSSRSISRTLLISKIFLNQSTCLLSSLSQDQPTNDERTIALFLYIFLPEVYNFSPPLNGSNFSFSFFCLHALFLYFLRSLFFFFLFFNSSLRFLSCDKPWPFFLHPYFCYFFLFSRLFVSLVLSFLWSSNFGLLLVL